MRYIRKQNEPRALLEWRLKYNKDINFGYRLIPQDVREVVHKSLLAEQGWLCAYTGRRIEADSSHFEHLVPQDYCHHGQDVEYTNIVACYPQPNTRQEAPYGAHQKKNWPAPTERHLFVSPLEPNCADRFNFRHTGRMVPANEEDEAAQKTIDQLKLNYDELKDMRRAAIRGTLQPKGAWLTREQAQRRLATLEAADGKLEPFCFVLIKVLTNHINTVRMQQK